MAWLFLATTSCITPVNLDPDEPGDFIAIDGFISTEEGPHEIIVHEITRFAGTLSGGTELFVRDAEVFITDQDGVRTDLGIQELTRLEANCGTTATIVGGIRSRGFRTPDGFRGEIGSTYVLTINTSNGRYVSTPQTIIPGPEIDSVGYIYQELPSSDNVTFTSGVDVYVRWQDPVETRNFYSWIVNGIYRIDTPSIGGNCCNYFPDGLGTVCYIHDTNLSGNKLAFDDLRANGQVITERVGFIEDDGLRFNNPVTPEEKQYYIEIEQLALTGEAFSFYSLLESQLAISGSIFDPPPAALVGNMRNLDNPDEPVIGFFGAFSIQKKGAFVNRNDLEFVQRNPRPCGDCRQRRWARTERPEPFR